MTVRGLGLLSLVVTLAIVGYLFSRQAQEEGPTSQLAQQAEAQASSDVAGTSFQAAAPEIQAWFAEHGTYAGMSLPPSFNVIVMRADASSYCLQSGSGTTVEHLDGPGGTPQPGACAAAAG
jgi:hypothetical protein